MKIWCPVWVTRSICRFNLHLNSTRAKLMHKHLSNSVQIWTVMCWDCFDILNLKSWSFFIHIHVMPLMPHVCLGLPNARHMLLVLIKITHEWYHLCFIILYFVLTGQKNPGAMIFLEMALNLFLLSFISTVIHY